MRRLLLSLLAVLLAVPSFAQAKHPFTFEDMMKLKRVGDPQVSPDGKWVIFSVVDVDLTANTKTPHIWIVPTAGGQEREIVSDQDADRPRWAPDGKRFAFLSTKEGGSQVWVAEFDGAAGNVTGTTRLTSIATEASGEIWSPDGKAIVFTSDVYPECVGEPRAVENCNTEKLKAAETSKVKAQIFTHLLYRHWNAYKEGKRTHLFATNANFEILVAMGKGKQIIRPRPVDLTPGDYDAPVFSLGGQDDYAISPDGKELCYASNHDKNPAASTNNDLWTVPLTYGADDSSEQILTSTKDITADNPASDTSPLYSPNGRYIAYRAQQRPGYESDRFRLMLYDRKTGEKKNLTESLDQWVGTFTWSPFSTRIFFGTADNGTAIVSSVLVPSGERLQLPLLTLATTDDFAVPPNGEDLLFTSNSLEEPVAIYSSLLCPNGKDNPCGHLPPPPPRKLTHFNDVPLSQISMSPLESFWFTGAHGDKVEGFLVKPPTFDAAKKYPVKFLIHGGPQGAWGDDWSYRWNPELFASPTSAAPSGYVVIMINFHGSTGYGQKFIDAINGDWGGAPFEDLMKGLDYAEQTYPFIDKNRECALGASYGGYMANWILGHTDRFKCIVTHDGMYNAESAWGSTEELWFNDWEFKGTPYTNRALYEKWSPHQYATNFKTPTLVLHGQRDYRLDVSEGFQLFTTLQMLGVPSKMLYFPDEGHWVLKPQNSQLWYKTVNDWVDQWTR
ncbi:MAG TPA: S9 family peptidase [Candidatus Acidoferrales bacterium]|nr:S9 family peptidase [Candidatus Acidoferrales bacterium]